MSATESRDDEAVESGGNVGASRWRKFTNIPAASHLMAMAIISGLSSLITYSDALDFSRENNSPSNDPLVVYVVLLGGYSRAT